ncbi:MAG: aminodeoxychorismate lyase [Pseudomonadales bacterium]|nr:aminodeoxychorismate lyase [Pseudomonadales bacterium]
MSSNGDTVLVNGVETSSISVTDRGLAYGDGLFETLRVRDGQIPLWNYHKNRLQSGCQRLGIKLQLDLLEAELEQLLSPAAHAVTPNQLIKVIITRGSGKRGYSPEGVDNPTRILFCSDYAIPHPDCYHAGAAVRICATRLGTNPLLAGIKHLNRLEQVIARSEWSNEYAEGLMRDLRGHVVDGTMSSFFVVKGGQLLAADLSHSGVAGVMRNFILEHAERLGFIPQIRSLELEELFDAEEMFICNSVFGIWPVRLLVDDTGDLRTQTQWSSGFPVAKKFQSLVASTLFPQ